jgi:hypothetical protein
MQVFKKMRIYKTQLAASVYYSHVKKLLITQGAGPFVDMDVVRFHYKGYGITTN